MQHRLLSWIGGGVAALALIGALGVGYERTYAAAGSAAPAAQAATSTPTAAAKPNGRVRRAVRRTLVGITADLTKQPTEQVTQALRDGKSLAQFATEHGSSGDAIVQAALDKAKARLDKAVQSGRITQQQADQRLATLREKLNKAVNHTRNTNG